MVLLKKFLQPFASYRLAFHRKQVLKSYNYIVCPLKLFVLILKRRVVGAKTFSYDDQTISLAVKTTKVSHAYLKVSHAYLIVSHAYLKVSFALCSQINGFYYTSELRNIDCNVVKFAAFRGTEYSV